MTEEAIEYKAAPAPPVAEPTPVRYAGFWMRFWAYTADLIIVFSVNGLVLLPLKLAVGGDEILIGYWTVAGIITTIVLYLYFLIMTKFYSQTLGKMIFGLKVIMKDGSRPDWSALVFREIVGRFLYRVLGVMVLLYIVVAFDDRKKGIHDIIADTRVVHVRDIKLS